MHSPSFLEQLCRTLSTAGLSERKKMRQIHQDIALLQSKINKAESVCTCVDQILSQKLDRPPSYKP